MKRKKKLDTMMDGMAEIKKVMKKKSAGTIITKELKATDDEEVKKKLRDKLVQLAIDLD